MSEPQSLPWYRDRASSLPFFLARKISSTSSVPEPFRTVALFPWNHDSLKTLWNGHHSASQVEWDAVVDEFSDAVVVGGRNTIYVFFIQRSRNPICYTVPNAEKDQPTSTDHINVAWALNPLNPLEPLALFSVLSVLYIFNVKRAALAGYLRGHGGAITSISTHPIHTNIFCTTSRDYSTRIYDLKLTPQEFPLNPCWPPSTENSHAGAAHGLHMTEDEGKGIGRCIIVLMGGRSGGHQAAVLGAAFHPDIPIIATCGLDRQVKIWHVPHAFTKVLVREDKPLFSSSRVHKARVLSITWLQPDILLTHSAPAIMKQYSGNSDSVALEPGQMVVWRWLGLSRFFPPDKEEIRQDILRGCASDYQESNSFKIISALSFPKATTQFDAPTLHVYQAPSHDPVVLVTYPNTNRVKILNVIHLEPRKPPPFPFHAEDVSQNTHLTEDRECALRSQACILEEPSGWEITTAPTANGLQGLSVCAMGMNGTRVVGIADQMIWIWKVKSLSASK